MMKKRIFLLGGMLAATTVATEASALPLFSRQLGVSCSACHFQHFPLLNSYGRDFKASGFTLTGAPGNIKGDHISMPATLNMSVLTNIRYDGISHPPGVAMPPKWSVPGSGGELIVSFGGRITDFSGFLAELTTAGPVTLGAAKLPILFPVGDYRVGPVIMTTGDQGIPYSFELLNTGATLNQAYTPYIGGAFSGSNGLAFNHAAVASAAQFFGTNTPATGLSLVAANTSIGYVNIAKYNATLPGVAVGTLPLTYVRIAGLVGLGNWDLGLGLQHWSGRTLPAPVVPPALPVPGMDYRATVIDAQLQGELGGMPLGVYASYGRAPAVTPSPFTTGNAFNNTPAVLAVGGATTAATSFNIGAELGVIPRGTIMLALRSAKVGGNPVGGITGVNSNAIMAGATYDLAQNFEVSLTHTLNYGSAWDGTAAAAYGLAPLGRNETNFSVDILF